MNRIFAIGITFTIPFFCKSQLTQDWVMNQLQNYAPTAFTIVNNYQINGPSIYYGGNSTSNSMRHLKYCELTDINSFLNSIATNVHETTHAYDSQLPYLSARQGNVPKDLSKTEGFFINTNESYCVEYGDLQLFPSNKLIYSIPESLQTLRYKSYITAPPYQSTQNAGVIGLLEEFNAYYHGSKAIFDLLPIFQQEYGANVLWHWPYNFTSNADAFYEFDFFIKEYLLYASKNNPQLYASLKANPTFALVYQKVRASFESLIISYEKKFDELSKTSTKYGYTTEKHSAIYNTLIIQIKSNRYQQINRDFLNTD